MNFEEWFLTNAFAEYPDHESLEKFQDCWKAAQEDMRERAALTCEDYSKPVADPFGGVEQGYRNACDDLAISIRALPIEV